MDANRRQDSAALGLAASVSVLKALAEPTRLRIVILLSRGELNVKDLTRILGQSQPRISRHLRLLAEAGLVERAPEGSWVYFRLADEVRASVIIKQVLNAVDGADAALVRDLRKAAGVKSEHQAAAQAYFQAHAGEWDKIRALHVEEAEVESAVGAALGEGPFDLLVDVGTGTGRMLELFASRYRSGIGLDLNPAMLAYARAKLARAGIAHAQVRHADIHDLQLADASTDAVVMHQVLHFLSDPQRAIREAVRILAPRGRLLIVDFAPHELEFLRERYAHERLGFTGAQVAQWLTDLGLRIVETRDLPPPQADDAGKLTVSLWVAEQPGASTGTARGKTQLERVR